MASSSPEPLPDRNLAANLSSHRGALLGTSAHDAGVIPDALELAGLSVPSPVLGHYTDERVT